MSNKGEWIKWVIFIVVLAFITYGFVMEFVS